MDRNIPATIFLQTVEKTRKARAINLDRTAKAHGTARIDVDPGSRGVFAPEDDEGMLFQVNL